MAIIKTCPVCEGEFKVTPCEQSRKFCSGKCRGLSIRTRFTRKCAVCEAEVETNPSQNILFCSKKCRSVSRSSELITKTCIICEAEFTRKSHRMGKFCSKKCSAKQQTLTLVKKCIVCDSGIITKKHTFERRKFCSQKCFFRAKTTEFKDAYRIQQLTEATIDGLDFSTIPISELDDSSINDIFNIDIINSLNIDDDITAFALKKN